MTSFLYPLTAAAISLASGAYCQYGPEEVPTTLGAVQDAVPLDGDLDVITCAANVSRVSLFRNISTLGTTYCASNANSTGVAAELMVTGFDKVVENAVVLTTTELPPASFGFYLGACRT